MQDPQDTNASPPQGAGAASSPAGHPRPAPADLALELIGALPCVRCTYNLRGLSVAGVCPECGTAIRATILARVDPLAKELQPLHTPLLTALLLLVWALAALLAAIASWVPRVLEGLERLGQATGEVDWAPPVAQACLALSALAALALVRPHRLTPPARSLAALGAILLHIPLLLIVRHIHAFDARSVGPYFSPGGIDPARATWRLLMHATILLIVLALRPSARDLAARSFVLRTGQVDRQTMYAMAAAVGVVMAGDILAILAPNFGAPVTDVLRAAALLFIGVGSLLMTLGLGSLVLDAARLFPVLSAPPLALSDIAAPAPRPARENNPA